MEIASDLDLFSDLILSRIDEVSDARAPLAALGFAEAERRVSVDDEGHGTHRVLMARSDDGAAFSFLQDSHGRWSDGALLVPATKANDGVLLDFVMAQPNLVETTEETRSFLAFAPEDVAWNLTASRFWTSKAPGRTGVNLTLGPALFKLPNGSDALALTASRNLAVQDPLTEAELAELLGPGSRLAKFVLIFSQLALDAGSDIARLRAAAGVYGYASEDPEDSTSFILDGGQKPNARSEDITSAIHVNDQTNARFEFALTFILDERLDDVTIRAALFEALGVGGQQRSDGTAWVEIAGQTFLASHQCTSAAFGNHAFLLQC